MLAASYRSSELDVTCGILALVNSTFPSADNGRIVGMWRMLRRAWSRHLGLLLVALVVATGTASFTRIIVAMRRVRPETVWLARTARRSVDSMVACIGASSSADVTHGYGLAF